MIDDAKIQELELKANDLSTTTASQLATGREAVYADIFV